MKRKRLLYSSENYIALLLALYAFLMPTFASQYNVNSYTYYYTSAILVLSITLLWGYSGTFSFGQAAFMASAGYIYGIISKAYGAAITPLAMILSILILMAFGGILGYFMFFGGVNDVFVGLITLCVGSAMETFIGQTAGERWQVLGVKLGGFNGMNKIPALHIGEFKVTSVDYYYTVLIVLMIVYLALRLIQHSKTGYALIAIRENRKRCEMLGYNVPLIQTVVFAVSLGLAALSGCLYAAWGNFIAPSKMAMSASIVPVLIVASGGRKNPTSAVIYSMFYYILVNKLAASGSEWGMIILGFILIIVLLLLPEGIITSIFKSLDRLIASIFRAREGRQHGE